MRRLLAIFLLVLAGPVRAGEFPVSSRGDIWFQADQAGFLREDGRAMEEYYVRIVNNQLEWKVDGDRFVSRVFVRLSFRDAEDHELGEASRRFEIEAADDTTAGSIDRAQIFLIAEPLDPRTHAVEIRVEDLEARKRGLLYLITGQRRGSAAKASLTPPPFVGQEFGLSDLQFAWSISPLGADSTFAKGSLEVIPNPARTYGLLQSVLSLYYEVYDQRASAAGPRTYVLRHEILSATGEPMSLAVDTLETQASRFPAIARFDLTHLEHGPYAVRATVSEPTSGVAATAERRWSLIWKDESWAMSEQDVLDAARVLFEEEEYERFQDMTVGDREFYLQDFWQHQDPTPTTRGNEKLEEFRRRVFHANQNFTAHRKKGMLTDRGRMYIRFGPADEVEQKLLPTAKDQLDQQIPELLEDDPAARTLKSEDQFDIRPYEIWTYTQKGDPLFPEREKATTVTGLRFVFVDETGTGQYVLRYTSDFIGY